MSTIYYFILERKLDKGFRPRPTFRQDRLATNVIRQAIEGCEIGIGQYEGVDGFADKQSSQRCAGRITPEHDLFCTIGPRIGNRRAASGDHIRNCVLRRERIIDIYSDNAGQVSYGGNFWMPLNL